VSSVAQVFLNDFNLAVRSQTLLDHFQGTPDFASDRFHLLALSDLGIGANAPALRYLPNDDLRSLFFVLRSYVSPLPWSQATSATEMWSLKAVTVQNNYTWWRENCSLTSRLDFFFGGFYELVFRQEKSDALEHLLKLVSEQGGLFPDELSFIDEKVHFDIFVNFNDSTQMSTSHKHSYQHLQ
jgi:hypothetical protein